MAKVRKTVQSQILVDEKVQGSFLSKAAGYLGIAPRLIKNESDFIELVRKGLPRKSLDQLLMKTGLAASDLAAFMHTSDRTLRRYKPSTLLNPDQSERLIQLAMLYARGEDVLGSLSSFSEWMHTRVPALGNRQPLEFLDTSIGLDLLMNELGRLEQGVFS